MPAAQKKSAANRSRAKYRDILIEVKDQVAWITLDRPRILNAFREQSLDEMIDALKSTREDPSIVCAVITGAGSGLGEAAAVRAGGRSRGSARAGAESGVADARACGAEGAVTNGAFAWTQSPQR